MLSIEQVRRTIREEFSELKARVSHPEYGRSIMIWLDTSNGRWMIVENNPATGYNQPVMQFHPSMLATWR